MDNDERRKYWETIGRLIELAKKAPLEQGEANELKNIEHDHSWDGLSCACGGGWMVGHNSGCPEQEPDHH